jgi:hypothetical protein
MPSSSQFSLTLGIQALQSFITSGTAGSTTQFDVPEELNL